MLTRLVLQPARDTVESTVERDGSRYARIPEPGACPFCLMLASRGAVYLRHTVLGREMKKYHDHCRCIGIEVPAGKDPYVGLPPINRQLREMWDANVGVETHNDWNSGYRRKQWRELVIYKRRVTTGSDVPVRWPRVPGIKVPTKWPSTANHTVFGRVEPLPPIEKVAGHVLFGWTDDALPDVSEGPVDTGRAGHTRDMRQGHRFGSTRPGATVFPGSWSDQKIVDASIEAIAHPDKFGQLKNPNVTRRVVYKEIDGIVIKAEYVVYKDKNGNLVAKDLTAYPIIGDGVRVIGKDGKPRDFTDLESKQNAVAWRKAKSVGGMVEK